MIDEFASNWDEGFDEKTLLIKAHEDFRVLRGFRLAPVGRRRGSGDDGFRVFLDCFRRGSDVGKIMKQPRWIKIKIRDMNLVKTGRMFVMN